MYMYTYLFMFVYCLISVFSNLKRFDIFLNINKINVYTTFVFFIMCCIFLVIHVIFKNHLTVKYINVFKNTVLFMFSTSFVIFLFYFYVMFHYKNILNIRVFVFLENEYIQNYVKILDTPSMYIIYLCYVVGFISIVTLGDRFWGYNYKILPIFLYFIVVVNLLCHSCSAVELFIYYEFLLLPSVLFVYRSGYTKKSQQANVFFYLWTQLGSLLVLLGILILSSVCGSTEFNIIHSYNFTNYEIYYIYLLLFVGFGVKVPVWPFHFWLIKVHVEAPSGFSIFLSGFLVKTAIFCFYKITLFFNLKNYYILPIVLCLFGMLDSSLKMWSQSDLKKLIAYATVQEMNAIYLLFNFGDNWSINIGFVFLLAHGVLSALMFYIIECIYKRYHSRSLLKIYGIVQYYPNLGISIWFMLVLFFGFPGTLKFYVEIQLFLVLASKDLLLTFVIMFIFIFVGSVGFARCWFSALYGHPGYDKNTKNIKMDLTSEEFLIILYLTAMSVLPSFFIHLL